MMLRKKKIYCKDTKNELKGYHNNIFMIDTGEDKIWAREDRRYSLLPVDPMNKEHKDPYEIDLTAPRLAWYKQKTWSVLG